MSAVCVFRAIDLYAGMKDAQAEGHNIFIYIEYIINVQYHRLLAAIGIQWQQLLAAILWSATTIEQMHSAEVQVHIPRSLPLSPKGAPDTDRPQCSVYNLRWICFFCQHFLCFVNFLIVYLLCLLSKSIVFCFFFVFVDSVWGLFIIVFDVRFCLLLQFRI